MIINLQIILIIILIIAIGVITLSTINKHIFNHIPKKNNKIQEYLNTYEEILNMYKEEYKKNELLIKQLKEEYDHYSH